RPGGRVAGRGGGTAPARAALAKPPQKALNPPAKATQPPQKRPRTEDFADVYLDRFLPPARKLLLSPEGRLKSRANTSYFLGLHKETEGDYEGAIRHFRSALEADPGAVKLAGRAAYLAAQQGEIETGIAILETSLRANPDLVPPYLALSDFVATYLDDEKTAQSESIRVARQALTRFPLDPDVVEHLAMTLLAFDDTKGAEQVLENALEGTSRNPRYWLRLGRLAQHIWPLPEANADTPTAINGIYDKAMNLAPRDLGVAESVADFYQASSQFTRAADIYRQIIERDPELISPREKLGRIYALKNDFDQVIEILGELLERHPDLPDAHKLLASVYEEREEFAEAASHYETALRIEKGSDQEYRDAAILLLRANNPQGAVDILDRARFHYPDNALVVRLLGISCFYNQDFKRAVSAFEDTVKIAGGLDASFLDDELYYRYGAACERLEQYQRAADLFHKAMELAPQEDPLRSARVYNYLGYMWLEQNVKIEEAGKLILKANDLAPDDGAFIDSLGWYYFRIADYEKALEALLRALELMPAELVDAVVLDHLAQTYFRLDDFDKA
ncbi:MAG: tetratricopeptide repeat protein, partial [Verrucomicrobiales bacterium]